jgi:hypothetical protein
MGPLLLLRRACRFNRITIRESSGSTDLVYPAEYRNGRVTTFTINQDDMLLQKDLATAAT